MEKMEALDSCILEISKGKIIKKKSSIMIPMVLMVIGGVLMLTNNQKLTLISNDSLMNVLFTVGIFILIIGLVMLFMRKDKYVYLPTGKEVKKYTLDFDVKELEKIIKLYNNREFAKMHDLMVSNNSGIQMTLMGTEDGAVCYSQLLKYIPYSFTPITEVELHEGKDSQQIFELISKSTK
ncbi:MAG TPA: hypothetical protein PKZ15_05275 [Paludibacteraceae bacterium]|nr:hypothetical protein [Paludibacteraceae bacterium]